MRIHTTFVALFAMVPILAVAPAGHAVDVVVEEDRYVGSHAIIVPAAVDEGTRSQLSTCADCAWRFAEPCRVDPRTEGGCASVVRGCPAGRQLLRLWLRLGEAPWGDRGLVCLTEGDIVPVTRLHAEVRDRFERRVPGPDPSCQPDQGAVTQIPLVCTSGQGGPAPSWDESLLGVDVQVRARPSWTWEFEPGSRLTTSSPGGVYPDMSVTHVYRRAGEKRVSVTTEWSGTYSADGLGPFPLEPIRQQVAFAVWIGQAKAVLTRP